MKSEDFRDYSALHQQRIVERGVTPEALAEWEAINEAVELSGNVPYPPPWAFDYYGGVLRETPPFPGKPGFVAGPITEEDLLELKLLLTNGKESPNHL